MKQASKKKEQPASARIHRSLREGALFVFSAIAIYLTVSLSSYHSADPGWSHSGGSDIAGNAGGVAGAWFADIFLYLFGYFSYLFPIMVAYSGWLLFIGRKEEEAISSSEFAFRGIGFVITIVAGCGLATLHFSNPVSLLPLNSGGILGDVVGTALVELFNFTGATLFLLALFLAGTTLFTGLSWVWLMDVTGYWTLIAIEWGQIVWGRLRDYLEARRQRKQRAMVVSKEKKEKEVRIAPRIEPVIKASPASKPPDKVRQKELFEFRDNGDLPALNLLDTPPESLQRVSNEALEAVSRLLELKLKDFGIEVEVVSVHPGPVITRYELSLGTGVKVSQVSNLAKDLARALSAISVRVVEVIAGKSVIGIEIPNEHREIVRLSETLHSKIYDRSSSPLTLALGKDIAGVPVIADIGKMPHLLVAGTTGSGKSVAINTMILSILFKARPEEVRMILIDPKMLELSVYDGIPHLLAPVVTDMSEAGHALRWCVAEMERRYRYMAHAGVRNIAGYNRKIKEAIAADDPMLDPFAEVVDTEDHPHLEPLPYIVVVVDELADMMMVTGKKVEELIARLAQKARASGIHLLLATQRPSVDVLTGLIKANIPTRIAFQVSSKIDSRTILDQSGAESLLGHGDMLYLPPGTSLPIRIHGAFVEDHEVHKVVKALKASGGPNYVEEILSGETEGGGGGLFGETDSSAELDPLYDEAVKIVTESRRASASGLQRRLKVGYNRASRMVEEMERAGVVTELQSNGTREVLAPAPPKE